MFSIINKIIVKSQGNNELLWNIFTWPVFADREVLGKSPEGSPSLYSCTAVLVANARSQQGGIELPLLAKRLELFVRGFCGYLLCLNDLIDKHCG